MPTLAELRAQNAPPPVPRDSMTVTLVEGQHLLARSEQLRDELIDLATEASRTDQDGERTGPPRKAGEGADLGPRAEEIKAERLAILDELAEVQATVALVGLAGGEWQRFKDDHPPRKDNATDLRLTGGLCNFTAVFESLGRFVETWDGEAVSADDWDKWLAERICYADRRDMASRVVKMHEDGVMRAPKRSTSSPTTESSATD